MKISVLELYHVSIPLAVPFFPSWIPGYPQTHNRFTLLRVETTDGLEGFAAGTAMGREREGLGDLLGAYLMGQDPTDIPRIHSLLDQAGYLGWRNHWIEPAFWDIKGKLEGKPVYELLGGHARPLEVYASTGEMHLPEKRAEEVLALREKGFKVAKLRIKHATLEEDIAHLETIARRVDGKIGLSVDVNQGWPVSIVDRVPDWTLERAIAFSNVCAEHGIRWLEEPLHHRDYDGNAALRKVSRVPISGAELNYGWHELKIMLEKDCFDIYQPDALFAGGITEVRQVIEACQQRGKVYSPHTWSNGIGFHVNWNLALSDVGGHHPLEYPLEPPSWIPELRDGLIEPILPNREGCVEPFRRPGLGFQIDPRALRRYARRFFRLTPLRLSLKVIQEKGIKEALALKKRKAQSEEAHARGGVLPKD